MDRSLKTLIATFFILLSFGSSAQLALDISPIDLIIGNGDKSDSKAPRTDLLNSNEGAFVYGPATRLNFKIFEEGSGLKTTYFKIHDLPYMQSDGQQMMPNELPDGAYRILYYSVDKAGNQEQIRMDNIYVDKVGPKITPSFGANADSFDEGLPIFSKNTQVIIEVVDMKVEVQKVTYKINDGPKIISNNLNLIDLTKEIASIESETIQIEIAAYDSFDNISKEVIAFKTR